MTNQLQPGNYMNVQSVNEFIDTYFSQTYGNTIKELPKHQGKTKEYYSTLDLKQIITPSIFKEMECEVITYMILSDEERKSYTNNELTFDQITKR